MEELIGWIKHIKINNIPMGILAKHFTKITTKKVRRITRIIDKVIDYLNRKFKT